MNIMINVLLPVIVLSKMSKDPALVEEIQPWHLGPQKALFIALVIPLAYGIFHFIKTRKFNLFSAIGIFSILVTGGVTLYLWNPDGTVKPDAALWFGLKEAIQPLILGGVVLASHRTTGPLFREFIYNESIFDLSRIESKIKELGKENEYNQVIFQNTLVFCGSFVISAIMNLILAYYFLGSLDYSSDNAQQLYNESVAKITGWGYVVIGLPLLGISAYIIFKHIKDLQKLTGLEREEVTLIGS